MPLPLQDLPPKVIAAAEEPLLLPSQTFPLYQFKLSPYTSLSHMSFFTLLPPWCSG